MNHKTKIIAGCVTLFVLALIFVGFNAGGIGKAQACDTGCYPDVSGYCLPSVNEAEIGETVTFTAYGQGGTNQYAYVWNGDDSLSANTRTVQKSYSTSGTKSATVTIYSNGQHIDKTCTVVIKQKQVNTLSLYCIANPTQANTNQTVTYTAYPTGGNGQYSYVWSGTDNLSGNDKSVSKSYSTSGTKTGIIKVTSTDGQSQTASCNTSISTVVTPCDSGCYPDVAGYCTVSANEADIDQTVTYTAYGQGGNNQYAYVWSGTDGLSSGTKSVSKSYSTSGTKSATVTIYSNGQHIDKTCTVVIKDKQNNNDNLGGYCEARPSSVDEDERVTWTAYPTGGNGDYDYDWSGDDNLDGSSKSITHKYDSSGTQQAHVRITSNGKSITRDCEVRVKKNNNNDNLDAYCIANPTDANINDNIKFTVYASGGDNYEYDWSGTDSLNGDNKTISHSYDTSGTKTATVRVRGELDNGDSDTVTATCRTTIRDEGTTGYIYTEPTQTQGGVYLDTIPATGISPTVKTSLFLAGTLIWSAFLGYMYVLRRNMKLKERKMIEEAMNS